MERAEEDSIQFREVAQGRAVAEEDSEDSIQFLA
jgi:hypothetical protein